MQLALREARALHADSVLSDVSNHYFMAPTTKPHEVVEANQKVLL
jgi:hypothetical protein